MKKISELWTIDKRYGVRIPKSTLVELCDLCKESGNKETGGLLFGYYSNDYKCANITVVSDAPRDSKKMNFAFIRGIMGLSKIVRELWKNGIYYLGEWHYHPSISINLSSQDVLQMKDIANSKKYSCAEPLCVVFGKRRNKSFNFKCFVFARNSEKYFELILK